MARINPPYTGDDDLDVYNQQVARELDNIQIGTSDVQTGTDDQDRPTVGTLTLGYQQRFLHVRYATSADGSQNFTNDFTTLPNPSDSVTIYQGLFNSASTTESDNRANYSWRELSVTTGWMPSYRTVGGRQIDWMFISTVPSGFTLDDGSRVIDLDNLPGAVGADGNSGGYVAYFQRSASAPSTPANSTIDTTNGNISTPPSGWTRSIPTTDGNPLWIVDFSFFGTGEITIMWPTPRRILEDGVNGMDGSDGQTGEGTIPIYQAASSQPTTPAASAGAPTGWSFTVPTPSAGERIYISVGVRAVGNTNYTWGTPIVFEGMDGDTGPRGAQGTPGVSAFNEVMYSFTIVDDPSPEAGEADFNQLSGNNLFLSDTDSNMLDAGSYFGMLPVGTMLRITYGTATLDTRIVSITPMTAAEGNYHRITLSEFATIADGTNITVQGQISVNGADGADGMDGADGTNGMNGLNTAIVAVYQRSTAEPTTAPTDTLTYTFSTATSVFPSDATISNGWSTTIPSGADQLWERRATAVSRTDTDTIAPADWSGVIQAGSTGVDGQDGINTATIFYYQRNSSTTAPAAVNQEVTYTFSSGTINPTTNNGWTTTIPAMSNGTHLWVTFATAANRMSMDTITASEFSTPELLAVNGADGMDGATGATGATGADGADGNSRADLTIYRRHLTIPDSSNIPSATARYTFSNGELRFEEVLPIRPGAQILSTTGNTISASGGTLLITQMFDLQSASISTTTDYVLTIANSSNTSMFNDGNYIVRVNNPTSAIAIFNTVRNIDETTADLSSLTGAITADVTLSQLMAASTGFTGTSSNNWYVNIEDVPGGEGIIYGRDYSTVQTATTTTIDIMTSDWGNPYGITGESGTDAFSTLLSTTNGIVFEQNAVSCDWNIAPVMNVITSRLTITTSQSGAIFASDRYDVTYNVSTSTFAVTASTDNTGDVNAARISVAGIQSDTTFTISITTVNDVATVVDTREVTFTAIPAGVKVRTGSLYLTTTTQPLPPTDISNGAASIYNFNTNTIVQASLPIDSASGLTWSNTEPTIEAQTSNQYWTVPYVVSEDSCGGTVDINYGAVRNQIDFNGIVRFVGSTFTDGTTTVDPIVSGDNVSELTNDADYTTTSAVAAELSRRQPGQDITVIDGALIETGTIRSEAIDVDGPITISTNGGTIESGLTAYPANLAQVNGTGFWIGVDNDGLPKFFLGRSGNHLAWDGNSLQLAGRVLTDSNILSVDGDVVSTRTFRTIQDDYIDLGEGSITGGTLTAGDGTTDPITPGAAAGTDGTTNIRYVFSVNVVNDPVVAQQQGNVLAGRHYYINIVTTNPGVYSIPNGNVVLCIGSTDVGQDQNFYSMTGTNSFYGNNNGNSNARFLSMRPIVPGTSANYMFVERESFAYPIRNTITFETLGRHELTLELIATAGVTPGWSRLQLDAYAGGIEDIQTVNGTIAGTNLSTTQFESVENIQVTPSANTTAWYSGLPARNSIGVRDANSINIHSGIDNTEVSVIIRGY